MRGPLRVRLPGLPERVTIYEVGARDGLQNESATVPVEVKAEFLARLADADPEAAYRTVIRLAKLPPEITVLPAHDHDAIATTCGEHWLE